MAYHFSWTDDMSVGESTIDAQHQRLLSQLNKVIDSMMLGVSAQEVTEALHFFEQYVKEHLSYEEEYMRRRGYQGIEEHIEKHDDFRNKYLQFKNRLESGSTPTDVLVEMEEFLGQWWVGHIGHEDRKYHLALDGVAKSS